MTLIIGLLLKQKNLTLEVNMIPVTDTVTKNTVFIAADKVVAVFLIPEGDHAGKTGINMVNSSIVADEDMMIIVNAMRAPA